jgi:hypothetical protein
VFSFRQATGFLIVLLGMTASASAAISFVGLDPRNTIPGTVATGFIADGQGVDWTAAVLKIDLTRGSVYNAPAFDSDTQQSAFWGFVPDLQWDSYVGIPGDGTAGIAGGAGDLGGGPQNIGGTGIDAVSVTWFNTATTDTGPALIANITLSDDAAGTMQFIATFADDTQVQFGITIESGSIGLIGNLPPPFPEPSTLSLLAVCGLGLLRRSRNNP